jgi:hypothetical protein
MVIVSIFISDCEAFKRELRMDWSLFVHARLDNRCGGNVGWLGDGFRKFGRIEVEFLR